MTTKDDEIRRWFNEIPSQDAAAVALSFYLLITLITLWLTIRTRTWFVIFVPITGALEVVGFATRIQMLHDPQYATYVIMSCCLIISPVLLAIVDYLAVGRLLRGMASSWAKRSAWLARLFTLSDILCLCFQGGGGGLMSSKDPQTADRGRQMMLIGLGLQLFFFTIFTFITIRVHLSFDEVARHKLRQMFYMLYGTIALMYVRNIFRVVEFVQGFRGYLATHEVYFYVFDFIPIFFVCVLFAVWHPGLYLTVPAASSEPVAQGTELSEQPKAGASSPVAPCV